MSGKITRLSLFILLAFLCSVPVFAQTRNDWWYTLERGKVMFRQGDYGSALLAFEDARRQRQAMYQRLERHFIELLSINEVRRMGDSLDWVERYIRERRFADAADALEELYYRVPRATFNNSASAALEALSALKDFPEAEYWIGETYLIEGELQLARTQFQKAFDLRQTMENSAFATDLLYKIAAICKARQEYNEMERILISIINADPLWSGSADDVHQAGANIPTIAANRSFTKQAMTRTLENDGINRFITMYRYGGTEAAEAHRQLGFYYYASGRHSRAQEHLMFAFLVQNTVVIDEVKRKQYNYVFTALPELAAEINRNPLLKEYAEKNEYYKTAYYLGASLFGNGKTASAREIWNSLSTQTLAGEWQNRSISQLKSPFVERALDMP